MLRSHIVDMEEGGISDNNGEGKDYDEPTWDIEQVTNHKPIKVVHTELVSLHMNRKNFRKEDFLKFDSADYHKHILGNVMDQVEYTQAIESINACYDEVRSASSARMYRNYYILLGSGLCLLLGLCAFVILAFISESTAQIAFVVSAVCLFIFTICVIMYICWGTFMPKDELFEMLRKCDENVAELIGKITQEKLDAKGSSMYLSFVYPVNCIKRSFSEGRFGGSSSKEIVIHRAEGYKAHEAQSVPARDLVYSTVVLEIKVKELDSSTHR
eukprot:Nk52_evm10s2531 gene=Nk52_evmTU10s2531